MVSYISFFSCIPCWASTRGSGTEPTPFLFNITHASVDVECIGLLLEEAGANGSYRTIGCDWRHWQARTFLDVACSDFPQAPSRLQNPFCNWMPLHRFPLLAWPWMQFKFALRQHQSGRFLLGIQPTYSSCSASIYTSQKDRACPNEVVLGKYATITRTFLASELPANVIHNTTLLTTLS